MPGEGARTHHVQEARTHPSGYGPAHCYIYSFDFSPNIVFVVVPGSVGDGLEIKLDVGVPSSSYYELVFSILAFTSGK